MNVRPLFMYLELSIQMAAEWAAFEPNSEPLPTSIRRPSRILRRACLDVAGALKSQPPQVLALVRNWRREVDDEAQAAHKLLHLDEADALFGKRTKVSDAHDRYANLEAALTTKRKR